MKNILNIIILLGALLATSSCSDDIAATTGNIVGVVRDARTNNLLEGVLVKLVEQGKSVTTGADGRYTFANIEAGNYTVQVSKAGYKDDSRSIVVTASRDNTSDNTLDFMLTPSVAALTLSQTSLDFGTTTTSLTFDIKNTGNAALTWSISEDIAWLSCLPTSGTTQQGETSSVVVNISREGLERGNYSQTIAISSNGGSAVMQVSMNVQGINVSVAPEALDFGSTTTSMQLTMTNNGSGSVSYSISPSNEWIKLSKTTGVFTKSDNITVSVDRSSFSPGDYSGNVTLRISDEDIVVPVRMNIPTKEKPIVSLYSIDDITYSGACFRGGIASVGSARVTRHGFCWDTADNPEMDNAQSCNLGDCADAKDFTYSATSLAANTTYYVRAYAENQEGISYSNAIKFQTAGTPEKPTVETGTVSGITTSQAIVAGNIVSIGNVSEVAQHGHVWGEYPNPTIDDSKTELGKTKTTGSYTSTLTGLKPNTTYHMRAYATNSIGTSYGEDVSITTLLGDIVLVTSSVTAITYNSATVACSVSQTGGHTIVERGVCWTTSASWTTGSNTKAASTQADSYEVTITGLDESTRYYARAYAKAQNGQTFYGNDVVFTTSKKDININKDEYNEDKNWDK